MRHVRVEWDGPFTVEQVFEMRGPNDGAGLYQIYGRHMIFGPDCLLYIGRTETTIGERLKTDCDEWLLRKGTPWHQEWKAVSIRIGRLFFTRDASFWNRKSDVSFLEILADVEAFEIFCHSPPYNGSNIGAYNGQPLTVINLAERGDLLPRISTREFNHPGVIS